jgi:hypothetical protein
MKSTQVVKRGTGCLAPGDAPKAVHGRQVAHAVKMYGHVRNKKGIGTTRITGHEAVDGFLSIRAIGKTVGR